MATGRESMARSSTRGLAAAGVDHAWLSYHYLDSDDIDGYASLLDDDTVVRRPGTPALRGRDAVERFHGSVGRPRTVHTVQDVFAAADRVVATGHVSDGAFLDVDFADIFTLSENGLFVAKVTYFFTTPSWEKP